MDDKTYDDDDGDDSSSDCKLPAVNRCNDDSYSTTSNNNEISSSNNSILGSTNTAQDTDRTTGVSTAIAGPQVVEVSFHHVEVEAEIEEQDDEIIPVKENSNTDNGIDAAIEDEEESIERRTDDDDDDVAIVTSFEIAEDSLTRRGAVIVSAPASPSNSRVAIAEPEHPQEINPCNIHIRNQDASIASVSTITQSGIDHNAADTTVTKISPVARRTTYRLNHDSSSPAGNEKAQLSPGYAAANAGPSARLMQQRQDETITALDAVIADDDGPDFKHQVRDVVPPIPTGTPISSRQVSNRTDSSGNNNTTHSPLQQDIIPVADAILVPDEHLSSDRQQYSAGHASQSHGSGNSTLTTTEGSSSNHTSNRGGGGGGGRKDNNTPPASDKKFWLTVIIVALFLNSVLVAGIVVAAFCAAGKCSPSSQDEEGTQQQQQIPVPTPVPPPPTLAPSQQHRILSSQPSNNIDDTTTTDRGNEFPTAIAVVPPDYNYEPTFDNDYTVWDKTAYPISTMVPTYYRFTPPPSVYDPNESFPESDMSDNTSSTSDTTMGAIGEAPTSSPDDFGGRDGSSGGGASEKKPATADNARGYSSESTTDEEDAKKISLAVVIPIAVVLELILIACLKLYYRRWKRQKALYAATKSLNDSSARGCSITEQHSCSNGGVAAPPCEP